jgi:hypothetical protein
MREETAAHSVGERREARGVARHKREAHNVGWGGGGVGFWSIYLCSSSVCGPSDLDIDDP